MCADHGRMQLSAANLLIAAQQAKHAQPKPAATPAFSLDGEDGFAPLAFKQKAQPAAAPQTAQAASGRLGANLDIRV
jgi:hypothetical protein